MTTNIRKLLLSLLGTLVIITGCSSVREFESPKWLAGDYAARGPMAEDIVKRRLLIGLSKADVEKLLGEPDHKSSYPHADAYTRAILGAIGYGNVV